MAVGAQYPVGTPLLPPFHAESRGRRQEEMSLKEEMTRSLHLSLRLTSGS